MKAAWKAIRAAVLAAIAVATWSGAAVAQQFEKVENIPKQEIPAGRFVSIAYGIIWLAVLAYVVFVAGGLRRVNQEIADLKRKLASKG
jgi:CcmD family protein